MKPELAAALLLMMTALPAAAAPGDDFAPCEDARGDPQLAGSLCAQFPVPLERGTPSSGRISLFLRQFPAPAPSRGQVWLVAGGSGAALYPLIGTLRQAFPGYDLIVPDRRGTGRSPAKGSVYALSTASAAYDLQAEIDRYSQGSPALLYGATEGSELVLKTLPLVPSRRVEVVILDSPAWPAAPLSATKPGAAESQNLRVLPGPAEPVEPGLDISVPRTLVLQGETGAVPPAEIERKARVTTYTIEGAPSFLMLSVPECAAPLVRDFVEGAAAGGAPCAAKLTIRF
jgi:pimeloyl-ACP methyl ester carboxylesterase